MYGPLHGLSCVVPGGERVDLRFRRCQASLVQNYKVIIAAHVPELGFRGLRVSASSKKFKVAFSD